MPNYHLSSTGIYQPSIPVAHRDDEYDQTGFDTLREMQERHFWYRGRYRFLLKALDRFMPKTHSPIRAIDLGGCRRVGALPGRPPWRALSKDRVGRILPGCAHYGGQNSAAGCRSLSDRPYPEPTSHGWASKSACNCATRAISCFSSVRFTGWRARAKRSKV